MSKNKPVIGLVGGIGSGKSTVARHMAQAGGCVIDADAIAQKSLDSAEVLDRIVQWWGPNVLDDNGLADRCRIAALIFEKPDQRERLEGLIHPIVAAERDRIIAQAMEDSAVRFIVLDVPLLLEVGLDSLCDRIVFVRTSDAARLERLARDRGWDETELARREKNQWPLDKKLKIAQNIIDNDGSATQCRAQIRDLLRNILTTS